MNRSFQWQLLHHHKLQELDNLLYSVDCSFQQSDSTTNIMDPTTLVTFWFKAPPEARTVELLGSWDNFQHPYRMHHDRRRGLGFWSGCFKFHNIIFDGHSSHWAKPRTGGLKQGGTYWFYYRLNDEIEAYDDSKDHTSSCPLLPGQTVNVIDVPCEVVESPSRCRSASVDVPGTLANLPSTHTLDPDDKYAPLDPPPISKVHGRCISDLAVNRTLENTAEATRESLVSPPGSPSPEESHSGPSSSPPVSLEHVKSQFEETLPSERYYAGLNYTEESFYDDGSSSVSRQSFDSAAPSFTHSSIVDAYGVESALWRGDQPNALQHDASQLPVPGSATADDDVVNVYFDFGFQEDATLNSNAVADDDNNVSLSEDPSAEDEPTESTLAPESIHDVQMYGSRPATSYSSDEQWRPRFYSLPNSRLRNHGVPDSDSDSNSEASPRASQEQSEQAESDVSDLLSPTFSAATVSTGGLNTPFRLSMQNSRTASAHANHDESIEGVAERLRSLGCQQHIDCISPISERDEPTGAFTGYALPQSEAAQSAQSLGKLSSSHTTIARDPSLPLLLDVKEESFADAIFSELGYLSASIS